MSSFFITLDHSHPPAPLTEELASDQPLKLYNGNLKSTKKFRLNYLLACHF